MERPSRSGADKIRKGSRRPELPPWASRHKITSGVAYKPGFCQRGHFNGTLSESMTLIAMRLSGASLPLPQLVNGNVINARKVIFTGLFHELQF